MSGPKPSRAAQRQKQLCVSCDRETLIEIDTAAKREGLTRSEWVRLRLEWSLHDPDEYPEPFGNETRGSPP